LELEATTAGQTIKGKEKEIRELQEKNATLASEAQTAKSDLKTKSNLYEQKTKNQQTEFDRQIAKKDEEIKNSGIFYRG